jgi:exonuclease VII large subunit
MFETMFTMFYSDEAVGGEIPSGVETESAAEIQTETPTEGSETGVDTPPAAEEKQNNFEKAFAKRLAAEREKWDQEKQQLVDQYKDYDVFKQATSYLQKTTGIEDLMSLKEEIELSELQERAESQKVSPEIQRRIEELEEKARKADEMEEQSKMQEEYKSFRTNLEEFATSKNMEADKLHNFMYEKKISDFEVAYDALRAKELESQLDNAKKDAVKEYLASKNAPKAEGSTGSPALENVDTSSLSWDQIRERAAARIRAANNPE